MEVAGDGCAWVLTAARPQLIAPADVDQNYSENRMGWRLQVGKIQNFSDHLAAGDGVSRSQHKRKWSASGSEYIHAVNPGNRPIFVQIYLFKIEL